MAEENNATLKHAKHLKCQKGLVSSGLANWNQWESDVKLTGKLAIRYNEYQAFILFLEVCFYAWLSYYLINIILHTVFACMYK